MSDPKLKLLFIFLKIGAFPKRPVLRLLKHLLLI
jgi:hypothetical protein